MSSVYRSKSVAIKIKSSFVITRSVFNTEGINFRDKTLMPFTIVSLMRVRGDPLMINEKLDPVLDMYMSLKEAIPLTKLTILIPINSAVAAASCVMSLMANDTSTVASTSVTKFSYTKQEITYK